MTAYLETPIIEKRRTPLPRYGITTSGYSTRAGSPTAYMIRLEGQRRWRRVMCWLFSNSPTYFVRVLGTPQVIAPGRGIYSLDATSDEEVGR